MAKTNGNKRKKYSNLSEAEAEDRRKRVNQQERDRQGQIKAGFDHLEVLLFKTAGANKKSKVQILHAVKEFIIQKEKCEADKNIDGDQTAVMYPNNMYQGQNIDHPVQHMGFPPNPEMPSMTNNFQVDPSSFVSGFDQTPYVNDIRQQTNFYPARDHSFFVDNLNFQDYNFPQVEPSTQVGTSTHVGLPGFVQNLPTIASSIGNTVEHQELQSYIQPFELPENTCNATSTFTSKTYVPQNTSLSRHVNSGHMIQDAAPTPQNDPQNTILSRNINSSNMKQDTPPTFQNFPQNTCMSRYVSNSSMMHINSSNMMEDPTPTSFLVDLCGPHFLLNDEDI